MADVQASIEWPAWAMAASWLGSVVENLANDGCVPEETADDIRKGLVHGVALITEAMKDNNRGKMDLGKEIIASTIRWVNDAIDRCVKGGGKS